MPLILPFGGYVPQIAPDAFIAENATIIGNVTIGPGASVWFGCILRGDTNFIRVGARSNLQDGTIVHVAREGNGTDIGDDVMIGHMAMVHACTIESGSLVGMSSCVLDGATVETGAMVAAGALVAPGKRVKSGEIWGGNPARCIREILDREKRYLSTGVAHYCELAQLYRTIKPITSPAV